MGTKSNLSEKRNDYCARANFRIGAFAGLL